MSPRRRSPLAVVSARGESSALHRLEGCSGPATVLLLHANGFCGLMYEPLVRRSRLRELATVYALDMPRQGSSPLRTAGPREQERGGAGTTGSGSPGALESYSSLALAAVDWLRETGRISLDAPLCALGHSGGGLAAVRAEQERPGTFEALYLYEPVVLPLKTAAATGDFLSRRNEERETSTLISSPPSPTFALPSTPSLEAGARRRRRSFTSREAALLSLRKKPPFALFDEECARIYVEEAMVSSSGDSEDDDDGEGRSATVPSSSSSSSSSPQTSFSSTPVSLAASPEDEAAVYLEAGPLGVEAGRLLGVVAVPVLVAAGSGSGESERRKKNPDLLHAPLARAAPRTARLLPRGKLEVYHGLGHLGPFEDPRFVGERAADAFAIATATAGAREEEGSCWSSLPPDREFEVVPSSGLSSNL